jgi:photosystem I protein
LRLPVRFIANNPSIKLNKANSFCGNFYESHPVLYYFFTKSLTKGENTMAAETKKYEAPVAKSGGKFPYPFRAGWAVFLLAINFLVAAYYFHVIQ